jgi:hypothetical protein
MGLSVLFIGRRREGRWYHREEMVNGEWSYLMFSFRREERKGQRPFQKRKGECETAFGFCIEGQPEDAAS